MQSFGRPLRPVAAAILVAAACSLCGCRESGPARHRVRGAVTFAGAPVRSGRIVFEPDGGRGNSGPQGFAVIRDGRYDTAERDCKGAVGGPTLVIIDGLEFREGVDATMSGRLLFPTHEERIDLPKSDTTRDFDVPKKGTR